MDVREAVAVSILAGASRLRFGAELAARPALFGVGRGWTLAAASNSHRLIETLLGDERPACEVSRQAHAIRLEADRLIACAADRGHQPIGWCDPRYPAALAAIFDPPPVLWVSGRAEALGQPAVAIVGSRAASPYALEVAERLGADLSARGIAIVSGLARGVDSAAHRGALAGGGETLAVLGSGADIIYPAEHKRLAREIAARGAVLSELPPGTPPRAHQFPRRNRIISGLALAVVVVEASEGSGSLITAGCALEQGREVMAVPGNVLSGRNRGAHALLKDGAKVVESAEDIMHEIGLTAPAAGGSPTPASDSQDPVLRVMTLGEAYDLDTLATQSGVDTVKLLPRLLQLELDGSIARAGSGRFVRSRRTC